MLIIRSIKAEDMILQYFINTEILANSLVLFYAPDCCLILEASEKRVDCKYLPLSHTKP